MYGMAEKAFHALDFTGLGYITKESFLSSVVVKQKVPYTNEELDLFFNSYNMFLSDKGISLDDFKKIFFPHLYVVAEGIDDEAELEAKQIRKHVLKGGAKQ